MLVKSGSAERNAAAVICRVVWLLPLFHCSGFISVNCSLMPTKSNKQRHQHGWCYCLHRCHPAKVARSHRLNHGLWNLFKSCNHAIMHLGNFCPQECIFRNQSLRGYFSGLRRSSTQQLAASSLSITCGTECCVISEQTFVFPQPGRELRCKQKSETIIWFCLFTAQDKQASQEVCKRALACPLCV